MTTGILHVHSDYSHDGRDPLESIVEFAAERNISFVALTDHAEDFDPETFTEYLSHCEAASTESVRLIPGLEYRFAGHKGLHLLAMGIPEFVTPVTPSDFINVVTKLPCFTAVAHPVLAKYRIPDDVLRHIDAIEVWNASYNTRYLPDLRAITILQTLLQNRPQVVGTAGLDQHDRTNDRGLRVVIDSHFDNPLEALRSGRFTNIGNRLRFDPYVSLTSIQYTALKVARWGVDWIDQYQERHMKKSPR